MKLVLLIDIDVWSGDNALDLLSGGARFEFQPEHRLS
jgi:hypothetical protein